MRGTKKNAVGASVTSLASRIRFTMFEGNRLSFNFIVLSSAKQSLEQALQIAGAKRRKVLVTCKTRTKNVFYT